MLRLVKGRIAGRAGLTALALVGFVSPAFATGGTLSPVQSTLQTLVTTLTGPIATSLAILAVIALGFFAWSGRLSVGSRRLRHIRNRPGVRLNANCELLPIRRWELAMDANELEKPLVIPLVKALTRAPTMVGVPYMYFMFEMVATSVIFLATHNLVNLLCDDSVASLRLRHDAER